MAFFRFLLLVFALWSFSAVVKSVRINLPTCPPPDYPQFGSYGPIKPYYEPGDIIHYYCDVETYIGGNYLRVCSDSGDWTGDTPMCDTPMAFETVEQTSTAEPEYANGAENARDGDRSMCSSTKAGPVNLNTSQSWTATFPKAREIFRVMVFSPRGEANYDVIIINDKGNQYSCGKINRNIERLEWVYHNCGGPTNQDIVAIQIKSLSYEPLQLCEVVAHGLIDPTCVDPHRQVLNGRLKLTRKTATVECNKHYSRDTTNKISCIQTGVWEGMRLQCFDSEYDAERINTNNNRNRPRPASDVSNSDWED